MARRTKEQHKAAKIEKNAEFPLFKWRDCHECGMYIRREKMYCELGRFNFRTGYTRDSGLNWSYWCTTCCPRPEDVLKCIAAEEKKHDAEELAQITRFAEYNKDIKKREATKVKKAAAAKKRRAKK